MDMPALTARAPSAGTFRLQHVSSGLYLSLQEGSWDNSALKVGPLAVQDDIVGIRDQHWFLGPIGVGSGSGETERANRPTAILSLFYGVSLCASTAPSSTPCAGDARSLRARAINARDTAAHWQLLGAERGETVSIILDECKDHALDVEGGQPVCKAAASPVRPLWRLIPDPVQRHTAVPPDWLSRTPSSTPLTLLNLPATHQSLALHGLRLPAYSPRHPGYNYPLVDNPRCQNRPPLEQLYDGIRVFDLRFTTSASTAGPVLVAQHGPARMGYTFLAVLSTVHHFLALHPTESAILSIRNETNSDPESFARAFDADISSFPPDLFFHAGKRSMRDVLLSEIRGKIVIIGYQANLPSEYASTTTWSGPASAWMTELKWNHFPFNYPTKIANANKVMQHARLSRNNGLSAKPAYSYMVAWNQSILGIINPIEAAKRLLPAIKACYAPEKCGTDGEYKFGLVYLDFYEMFAREVENIIRSNEGCGEV